MNKIELNSTSVWTKIAALRQRNMNLLAPKFKLAVEDALEEMRGRSIAIGSKVIPLDVIVFETARSNELQEIYFSQGTTKAKTAEHSWHYYRLAIDCISAKYEWFDNAAAKSEWPNKIDRLAAGEKWFHAMAGFFKAHNCSAGADWSNPDMPHIQWLRCEKSPPDSTIQLLRDHDINAVWEKYHAA